MTKVLFVCLGNICRSPTAEGVFRDLVRRRGLENFIGTDSAGTSGWHIGAPPDPRSRAEAQRRGVCIDDLRSRKVDAADFARFDYVVAMDEANMADLEGVCPAHLRGRIHLFTSFAPGGHGLRCARPLLRRRGRICAGVRFGCPMLRGPARPHYSGTVQERCALTWPTPSPGGLAGPPYPSTRSAEAVSVRYTGCA